MGTSITFLLAVVLAGPILMGLSALWTRWRLRARLKRRKERLAEVQQKWEAALGESERGRTSPER